MIAKDIASFIGAAAIVIAGVAFAEESSITFPVAELGNCESKMECKQYCDIPENREPCLSFAEKNGLMSREEAAIARKLGNETGPGGCRGQECETYCEDESNAEECIAFAEKHDLIPKEELEIAKKMIGKTGPGGCRGSACKKYCEDSAHMEECIAFAEENGLMPPEELAKAKKMRNITGPGGCRGQECKTYCDDPAHGEECLRFAEENGLMPPEEIERAKKMIGKSGPGGCKGQECRTYCDDSAHTEECTRFAVENGFMTEEEAKHAQKLMGKPGPGGCRGQECKSYCDGPTHREECMSFAIENGFMTQEEAEHMQNGQNMTGPGGCRGEECRAYCEDSANSDECKQFFGSENEGGNERGPGPNAIGQAWGPPPCDSPESCKKLEEKCSANPDECRFMLEGQGAKSSEQFNGSDDEKRRARMKEFQGRPGQMKPYQPEGLMPPEAFRRPQGEMAPMPQLPENASVEQRRVYEMNLERYQQFQASEQSKMEGEYRPQYNGPEGMPPPPIEELNRNVPPASYPSDMAPPSDLPMGPAPMDSPPPIENFQPPPEAPRARIQAVNLVAAAAALISALFGI